MNFKANQDILQNLFKHGILQLNVSDSKIFTVLFSIT